MIHVTNLNILSARSAEKGSSKYKGYKHLKVVIILPPFHRDICF